MAWDYGHFKLFLDALLVDTKELGRVSLGTTLLGTQKRWLREMDRGMREGVHEFVTLKCRQIGISTISLAMDMYMGFNNDGLGGAIVVHEEGARDQFRAILQTYYDGLPEDWTQDVRQHNRNQIVFENRTIFQYKVAGTKETSAKTLGRSSALTFCHCTEVAYWGDKSQIQSLKDSFAEHNPLRWYHWESTANGFVNAFHDMWVDAQQSVTIRPIFVTWWSNEFYRAARGTPIYDQYFGFKGRPTQAERDFMRAVKDQFDYDIDDEQLAWRRWCLAEKKHGDEDSLRAEYPNTPEEAFVATGSNYFSSEALTNAYRRVLKEKKALRLRVRFGETFAETVAQECTEREAMLRIWEQPDPNGYYSIGADPAHSTSETSDRYTVSVHRNWSNRCEQVAEFSAVMMNTKQFAWVIAYLAGCYQPCVYNIELNGQGGAVLLELQDMRRTAMRTYLPGGQTSMLNVVRKMQDFLYVREDSIRQRPIGSHTLTTDRAKESYMGLYRSAFESGHYVPHSLDLLNEMKTFVRDGGWIGAEGDEHDDRCIAGALAYKGYHDQQRATLIMRNINWVPPGEDGEPELDPNNPLQRMVQNYLQTLGYGQKPPNTSGAHAYNLSKYKVKSVTATKPVIANGRSTRVSLPPARN